MKQPKPVANDSLPIVDQVITDLLERKRVGIERYGVALQANNGRKALWDAYEEILDLAQYIKQHLVEEENMINKVLPVNFAKVHPNAVVPSYAKSGDAGMDLTAVSFTEHSEYVEYDTGLAVEIPAGHVGLVFPRSSISNTDLVLSNSVGVIDSGYRSSIKARFICTHEDRKIYKVGDRILQLIVMPYPEVLPLEVPFDQLSKTERGAGGFGSSGA